MDAGMAAAQELRDGEEEPGDACQAELYGVFLEGHSKETRLPDQARKPLGKFERQSHELGVQSSC